MIKDKETPIGKPEVRKLMPDKVIDINEGIRSLLDVEGVQNLDRLRERVASCCLQACDCCLQVS